MKKLIILLILLFSFFIPASAETDLPEEIDILEDAAESAKKFDPDFDYKKEVQDGLSGKGADGTGILKKIIIFFSDALKEGMGDAFKIMLTVFIFGIILKFIPPGSAADAAFFATYTVIFTMALFIFNKTANIAITVINEMNFFVKAAVPVMCTLSVPGGKFISSVSTAAVIGGICAVTESAAKILMPLTCMMASLSAANNLSPEITLKGLETTIKKIISWSIGIIMTVFVSLIKIRGLTGAGLDNITGKTLKFAVGNMVPIVGGLISDSLENIISYSNAILGSCGAAGIIALIYMIIPPVVKIAGILVALRLTGIVTSPVSDGRITCTIDNFSDILGIVLVITVMVCILFIIAMGSLAV